MTCQQFNILYEELMFKCGTEVSLVQKKKYHNYFSKCIDKKFGTHKYQKGKNYCINIKT